MGGWGVYGGGVEKRGAVAWGICVYLPIKGDQEYNVVYGYYILIIYYI